MVPANVRRIKWHMRQHPGWRRDRRVHLGIEGLKFADGIVWRFVRCSAALARDLCAVSDNEPEITWFNNEECAHGDALGRERRMVEEAEPAFAGAIANLVVAAHHDPGGRGEEGSRRFE